MKKNPRFSALKALQAVHKGSYIEDALEFDGLNDKDRRLMETIVYETVRHQIFLDSVIDRYVRVPDQLQHTIRLILRMAVCQMRFLDRIPDHAIVDESVRLTKIVANRGASGLVNGVLRSIIRSGEDAFSIKEDDAIKAMSIRYSFPEAWVIYFKRLLKDDLEPFFRATLERAPLSLRAICGERNRLEIALEKEGYEFERSKIREEALIISNPSGLFDTEAYREGTFYVQDEASQKVVDLFTDKADAEALDLCAAPGGKSFQMAERFARVDACDISKERLARMEENIGRLGYKNIETIVRNGKTPLPKKQYDRILVDAPCSSLGLLRKKPEIKYRLKPEDLGYLARTQRLLLENAYAVLKEEGELVYSTCTVTLEENEGVLASFLSDHPECRLKEKGMRYWPHRQNTDGFSMAIIVRKDNHALDGNDPS